MWGKIAGVIILVIIAFGFFVPIDSVSQITDNNSNSSVAVTYGQTTYDNQNYKSIVDSYFKSNSNNNLSDVKETIITANDVNQISKDISNKTYSDNQILSCAMVDLNTQDDLKVDVDKSKITLVTESMYKSALKSAGITQGYVLVTSPTTATGESALAGVMEAYETASGKEIPDTLKDAANKEIYTESQVVNDSNVSADEIADIVSEAKEEASKQNTTDTQTIVNIVNNIASNNNINISDNNINSIADSIVATQSVQDQASNYQTQISDFVNNDSQTLFEQVWGYITSLLNGKSSSNIVDNN